MKKILFVALVLCGFAARAADVGVVAGIRSDSADGDGNSTVDSKTGFQAGAIAKFDVSQVLQIRSGLLYTQRGYGVDSKNWKFTSVDIPVNLLYKFSDYGGAFIGPNFALNVSKDCTMTDGTSCTGVSAVPVALQLGVSFKFAPQLGFEAYYEAGLTKIADGVKSPKAVAASLMITFD